MMMVDTNIVLDLIERDTAWHEWSVDMLASIGDEQKVTASAVVVGELVNATSSLAECLALLRSFGIEPDRLDIRAGYRAGQAQAEYRRAGGTREKLLADFLIGAHAEIVGAPLLTRDPRRYRRYFPDLKLITPETENG